MKNEEMNPFKNYKEIHRVDVPFLLKKYRQMNRQMDKRTDI